MTICLNLIIKDEAPALIQRCLESVRPLIDSWLIVDSSGSEEVKEVVHKTLQNIPGELNACPWVSPNYNLNVALQFSRGKSDYLLTIDPDDELIVSPDFQLPQLVADEYFIQKEVNDRWFVKVMAQKIFYKNLPRVKWVMSEEGFPSRLYIQHPTPTITLAHLQNISTRSLENLGAPHEA